MTLIYRPWLSDFTIEISHCRFQGIGIRIEDDVLITETGYEVLTGSMPKEIKHIETLLNNHCHDNSARSFASFSLQG